MDGFGFFICYIVLVVGDVVVVGSNERAIVNMIDKHTNNLLIVDLYSIIWTLKYVEKV